MDDDNPLRVMGFIEGPQGKLDTPETFAHALAGIEAGTFLVLFQESLPEMPEDDEDDREYLCCKIMRDSEGGPPPFWLIGLDVDQEDIKAAAEEIIQNALGGKITHSGYAH
jgi:hypothetical protein